MSHQASGKARDRETARTTPIVILAASAVRSRLLGLDGLVPVARTVTVTTTAIEKAPEHCRDQRER